MAKQHHAKAAAGINRVDQRLAYAALPVTWLGCAGSLFSLPPLKYGFRGQSDPILIAGFVAAGLAALILLLWLALGGKPRRNALLAALPAFLLALWLLISGPTGLTLVDWRWRLLGDASFAQGALWYAAIGLWILLADLLLRHPPARQLALLGALLAGLALVIVYAWDLYRDTYSLLHVRAFYAWPALFLPVWAAVFAHNDPRERGLFFAALVIAALLLALGNAITLVAAAMVLATCALLWPRLPTKRALAWLRHPTIVCCAVAAAALLPLLLVSLPALTQGVQSLEARRLTWLVLRETLSQDYAVWLYGMGSGTMSNSLAAETNAAGFPIWKPLEWDFLFRSYTHAHNWLLHALHEGGVPAVLLLAWLILAPLWLAPPKRRGLALGVVAAYFIGLGLWFEHFLSLPFIGLAWAALVQVEGRPGEGAAPQRVIPKLWGMAAIAGMLLLATTNLWAALALERLAASFNRQVAWFDDTARAAPPPIPADPRITDVLLAEFIREQGDKLVERHDYAEGQPVNAGQEAARMQALIDMLHQRLANTRSVQFAVNAERLLSDLMLRPSLAPYRPALNDVVPLWRNTVERTLQLAPRRIDAALGYLNWTFTNGQSVATRSLARQMLLRDPEDPIGLFYEAALLVQTGGEAEKIRATQMLRRAMAAGLERFFPLDDAFKAQFGAGAR